MQYKSIISALILGLAVTGQAAEEKRRGRGGGFKGRSTSAAAVAATATATAVAADATATASAGANSGNNGGNQNVLSLNPSLVQSNSEQDGLQASGSQAGEAASATDPANFINFCQGKTLTNGLQVKTGSCNGIVMGDIPSKENMVSTIITFPQNGQDIPPNQTFNFSATSINMVFGSFTNAQATYYGAPQALDPKTGNIIGHLHFTTQKMTDANLKTPLDPKTFAFFKGVDDAGDGSGDLQAVVKGGLEAGTYRVCTMTSASNHQPVLMPVAQRGPQDDCIRFTVGQGSGTANTPAPGSNGTDTTTTAPASGKSTVGSGNKGKSTGKSTGKDTGKDGKGKGKGKGKGEEGKGKGKGKGKGEEGKGKGKGKSTTSKATTGSTTPDDCDKDKKKGKRAVHMNW